MHSNQCNFCGLGQKFRGRLCVPLFCSTVIVVVISFVGCRGVPTSGERQARSEVKSVQEQYRPESRKEHLPEPKENSAFEEYLRYAILNQPQVESAYYDWLASVERITQQRSLPDPRLTFEMYIQDTITSLMPGLMMDFPGPGKRAARAKVATAESDSKYFAFETSVLQSAFALKKSFFKVHFVNERILVNRQTLALLNELERLARAQNEVGKVTLQDVLRAQIEQGRVQTEVANLEDSRGFLLEQFKAALGLSADESPPP